MDNNST